jgi:hypothetical protein
VVDVTAVRSLGLWPMEADTGVWGVALMRLQADLPTSENANVTLLTFGDVQLENAVQLSTTMEVTVGVNEYVNVRRAPSTEMSAVGVLAPGQTVKAIERLADNSWLRVELPDSGVFGWVYTSLLTFDGNLDSLNVAEGWTPHYRPMEDMTPAWPPSPPAPYETIEVEGLPITVLDRAIEVAPPLTQEAIDALLAPPVWTAGATTQAATAQQQTRVATAAAPARAATLPVMAVSVRGIAVTIRATEMETPTAMPTGTATAMLIAGAMGMATPTGTVTETAMAAAAGTPTVVAMTMTTISDDGNGNGNR